MRRRPLRPEIEDRLHDLGVHPEPRPPREVRGARSVPGSIDARAEGQERFARAPFVLLVHSRTPVSAFFTEVFERSVPSHFVPRSSRMRTASSSLQLLSSSARSRSRIV